MNRRSRSQPHDVDPQLATALMPLVKLLLPALRAELASSPRGESDTWVSQDRSPLGRKAHCRLARSGALQGARKVGRKWFVPAASVAAFIEGHGNAAGNAEKDAPSDDHVALLADKLGISLLMPRA